MVLGPRANFACASCSKKLGKPFVIENLSVKAKSCPICKHKRGFVRLFDSINVGSGNGRIVSKIAEKALLPMYDKHSGTKQGAQAFENFGKEAMEKAYEKATPKEREQIVQTPFGGRLVPAQAALSTIPSDARAASREVVYPALTNRRVVPSFER